MLSLYTLKSASEASKYYKHDNYYAKEGGEGYSEWLGKGTELLGLEGVVVLDKFKALLEGRLPNNEAMVQTKNGLHHRPGYDLTFSAPKSVSILGIVGGDERVINAHREAIREVLTRIESEYAAIRAKSKGEITIQKTGNMTFATFEHHDSRALDPNLHTHCILMNFTQREDGAWRTIFGDELYTNKLLNGMHYRAILAEKLLALGLNIVQTSNKGTFELEGFEQSLIDQFSKRRLQIKEKLADMGLSGGKAAKIANFDTRLAKKDVDPEHIQLAWEHEIKACGKSMGWLKDYMNASKARGSVQLQDPSIRAKESVELAIEHLTPLKHVFIIKDVFKAARGLSLLPGKDIDILRAIEAKIEKHELLYVGKDLLTTQKARELELNSIMQMRLDKGKVNPISMPWIAEFVANRKLAIESQRDALKLMLTTKDRQVLISSDSKVMLQEVIKEFTTISRGKNYYVTGLTQNTSQVESLKEKIGFGRTHTIEGFLKACEFRAEKTAHKKIDTFRKRQAREIWVINSGVSLVQVNRLQQWSQHFGARLIWTELSNQPIPALDSLNSQGISNQTIRDAKTYNIEKSLKENLLSTVKQLEADKSLRALPNHKDRIESAVDAFMLDIGKTGIVVLTNSERVIANHEVREKLKAKLILQGSEHTFQSLQSVPYSSTQKTIPHLYQIGDVILFKKEGVDNGLTKVSYLKVSAIDFKKDLLILSNADNSFEWQPTTENVTHIEIFRETNRAIMVGDTLSWTRTLKDGKDKALDRISGQRAIIDHIEGDKVSVVLQNGRKSVLNTNETKEQHWDHGYASLLNAKTPIFDSNVILVNSHHMDLQTAHQMHDYVQNNNKKLKIICDDIGALKKRIQGNVVTQPLPLKVMVQPYDRVEALKNAELTPLLFPKLQIAYINVIEKDKELYNSEVNKPLILDAYSHEFREACEKIDYICAKFSEREAVFSLKAAMDETFHFDGLNISEKLIEQGFEKALSDGWLRVVKKEIAKDTQREEVFVTTRDTCVKEEACINNMVRGQKTLTPIIKVEGSVSHVLELSEHLTAGQKEAVALTLTTTDRVIGVQGVAGSGKTTMLKEVNRLCNDAGIKVIGLSNMASAKNRLAEATHSTNDLGIETMTLAKFLIQTNKSLNNNPSKAKEALGNSLIVLDEASFASSHDLFLLLTITERLGARLLLIGDIKQMGAIEAGKPFYLLLGMGMQSVAMTENVRFNDPNTLNVMQDLYAKRVEDALDKLSDSILEIPDKQERLKMMADLYLTKTREEQEKTLVITPLNEDRQLVNQMVRDKLKKINVLQGEELKMRVLLPKDVKKVEKSEIYSYELQDVIRFNAGNTRNGIKLGDYAEVVGKDFESHRLLLKLEDGRQIYWSPKKELTRDSVVEIYQSEQRTLMKGDKIIWKRNNEEKQIFNGDKSEIVEINQTKAKVILKNASLLEVDLKKSTNQHLDYAYAVTLPVAQGRDVPWTFGHGESQKANTKKNSELKVGDKIILPKADQPVIESHYNKFSKVVMVQKIEGNTLSLQDRDSNLYKINTETRKCQTWGYYPPFENRKERELPKSTSLNGFLVEATRGDNFVLVVDNLDYYCETRKKHHSLKESATEHLTPDWKCIAQKVDSMTVTITGKASKNASEEANDKNNEAGLVVSSEKRRRSRSFSASLEAHRKPEWIDKEVLIERLHGDILGLITRWRGSPNKVTAREARWGKKGSFSVVLRGTQAGAWSDFETGEKGKDLISLYKTIYSVDFKQAIEELAKDCGLRKEGTKSNKVSDQRLREDKLKNQKLEKAFQQEKITHAKKIYDKGFSIKATLAETYLRRYRGIKAKLPEDFRFSPGIPHPDTRELTPALIVPIRDKEQSIIGIVRIFLNKEGDKLNGQILDAKNNTIAITSKANLGLMKGGAVHIQSGIIPGTLWVAEGVETALSIAKARPNAAVLASLSVSQLKGIPVGPEIQKVIICADNDGPEFRTKKAVLSAVEHHLSNGRRVFIAMPYSPQKCDFNDLLREGGVQAVQASLDKMVEIKSIDSLKTEEPRLDILLKKMNEASLQKVSISGPKKRPLAQVGPPQMER